MNRDYSEEVYERMIQQIDQINNETSNWIEDGLGDLMLKLGKWVGLIQTTNTKAYQKQMLDMNDTTKKELKQIFDSVRKIDAKYAKKIKNINDRQKNYAKKINKLSEIIQPGVSMMPAGNIRKLCSTINKDLTKADRIIDKQYTEELNYRASIAASNALKGMAGATVGIGVGILSMPAKWALALYTGGPSKMGKEQAKDTWGLINNVFGFASAASSLGALAVGEVVGGLKGKTSSMYGVALETAETYAGANGLADAMEAYEKTNGKDVFMSAAISGARAIDDTVAAVDLIDGVKESIGLKGFIPKDLLASEQNVLNRKDMTEDALKHAKKAQNFYQHLEEQRVIASRISNAHKIASNIVSEKSVGDGVAKYIAEHTKSFDTLKKICNLDETFDVTEVS